MSLAIDILKVDPEEQETKAPVIVENPLRDWAVDVLRLDSPVPISQAAQHQLRIAPIIVYDVKTPPQPNSTP